MKELYQKIIKYGVLTLGWLFLFLGIIGIFLPLLPTTPFLLLTGVCFNYASPKFHSWLLNHRWFGPPILAWQKNKSIQTRYKVIATVTLMASGVMVFSKETIPIAGKIAFTMLALALLLYLWTRRSS